MSTQADAARAATKAEHALDLAPAKAVEGGWRRTFESLSNPNFRLLWMSMLFSFTAIQMTFIAQGFITFDLAGNAKALGIVSLGWGASQLICTPFGGVAADRLNKRQLIVFSQSMMALTSLTTALLIQTGLIALWQIFVLALITGAVFSFNVPARQAWIPELVERDQLMNAVALNTSAFTATGILGPALFGALIAVPFIGIASAYYVMSGCFVVTVVLLLRIPGTRPVAKEGRPSPLRELGDGIAYIRAHRTLPILLLMGFIPIVVGMPYRTFFPVFQERVYGVSESWLGAMGAMAAVGALAGSLAVASMSATSKRALLQIVGGIAFGVSLIAFASAGALPVGLTALLFVGLASNGYWALNNTMVLGATDPEYYGRVMSVYMLSWSMVSFATFPESALVDAIGAQQALAVVGVVLAAVLVAIGLLPAHRRLLDDETGGLRPAPTSS